MTKNYTPNEIYNWKPIETTKDIYILDKQFDDEGIHWYSMNYDKNEKIELKFYAKESDSDDKYIWELFSVWFDGKPVAICERGGRYGEGHNLNFPTDEEGYKDLIDYLKSLTKSEEDEDDIYDPNKEIPQLGKFEDQQIGWYYDPNLNPPYKEGDVVEALVAEKLEYGRYIFSSTKMIKKKVKIAEVDKYNSHRTYSGYELERQVIGRLDFQTREDTREVVDVKEGEEITGKKMSVTLNFDLRQII